MGLTRAFSWAKKQYATIKKHEDVYRERGYYYSFDELIKFIAQSWVKHLGEVRKQKKKLNLVDRDILLEFTYEGFCARPEEHVDLICSFLSLNRERLRIDDLSYIESKNYKWKENLGGNTINEINKIVAPILKEIRLDLMT